MKRLFVDTSAWFAFVNRKDPDHEPVRTILNSFHGRLITSNFIFDETVSLCLYRLNHQAATAVGSVLTDPQEVDLIRITAKDEQNAWSLFCNRTDQSYSFTDCTSFELMRRLGLDTALTLDSDFSTEGFQVLP